MANPPGSGDQALLQGYDDDAEGFRVVIAGGAPDAASTVEQQTYDTVTTGEFAPGVAAAQLPSVAARLVRLKARKANAGPVAVGGANTVTLSDGTTDVTTGLQMSAGDDSGWLPVDNLDRFWAIGTGANDSLTYMVLA